MASRGQLEPVAEPQELGPFRVVGRLAGTGVLVGLGADDAPVVLRILTTHDVTARRAAPEVEVAPRHAALPVVFRALDAHVPFVASPLLQAVDLRSAVGTFGARSRVEVAGIATAVAEHLVALHRAGLVDGRLTPSQVLLAEAGPFVLDPPAPRVDDDAAVDLRAFGEIVSFTALGRPLGAGPAHVEDLRGLDQTLAELVVGCTSEDLGARPTAETLLRVLLGGRLPAAPARAVAAVLGRTWKLEHELRAAVGPGAVGPVRRVEPDPPPEPSPDGRLGGLARGLVRSLLTLVVVLAVVAALAFVALRFAIR